MLAKSINKLFDYFNDSAGDALPIGLIFSFAFSLAQVGSFFYHSHSMGFVVPVIGIILFAFTAASQIGVRDKYRGSMAIASLFLPITLLTLLNFLVLRTLVMIPVWIINFHLFLVKKGKERRARKPEKKVEALPMPVQAPFRNSAHCQACERPL